VQSGIPRLSTGPDDLKVGVQVPIRARILFSPQTGSGVHSASYLMGTGSPLSGVKLPVREADH
jgi:hypothetical protein